MTMHSPSADTIAATEPGPKIVLSPETTVSREINAGDIKRGTCLRCNHRPPLYHGQAPLTSVSGRHGFRPPRVSPQVHSTTQKRINYDVCAANVTTIPTYEWLSLNLNLGLPRDFTPRFGMAEVRQPLICVDLFSHFGLLVDSRHNRLLDVVTDQQRQDNQWRYTGRQSYFFLLHLP
jgi:hypothetical protein